VQTSHRANGLGLARWVRWRFRKQSPKTAALFPKEFPKALNA